MSTNNQITQSNVGPPIFLSQNGIGSGTQINIKAPYTEILFKMIFFNFDMEKNVKRTYEKFRLFSEKFSAEKDKVKDFK